MDAKRKLIPVAFATLFAVSVLAACDSPTVPRMSDTLSVYAQLSRTTFRSGDTTTLDLTITNKSRQPALTSIFHFLPHCGTVFDVMKGTEVIGAGGSPGVCTMPGLPSDTIAPGASRSMRVVWRGELAADKSFLKPGAYQLRARFNGVRNDVLHSNLVDFVVQ